MEKSLKKQFEILNQQIRKINSLYHYVAIENGVPDSEFWLWYTLLILGGEYTQQDICEMWSLPKQTINTVITNLTKKGYVNLEIIPGTRNKKMIRLSKEGKKYGENIMKIVYDVEENTLTKMTKEERQTCIDALSKYTDILKERVNSNLIK